MSYSTELTYFKYDMKHISSIELNLQYRGYCGGFGESRYPPCIHVSFSNDNTEPDQFTNDISQCTGCSWDYSNNEDKTNSLTIDSKQAPAYLFVGVEAIYKQDQPHHPYYYWTVTDYDPFKDITFIIFFSLEIIVFLVVICLCCCHPTYKRVKDIDRKPLMT
eukprot:208206_1